MQNALRKWLVGFGLVAALLALAVPALAQNNYWQSQSAPVPFPTPVTAMTVDPATGQVEAATAGGGYPGGTLGLTYFAPPAGDPFAARTAAGDPPGDDYTAVAWDGAYYYAGAWNTGLWDWNGAIFTNPTATAPLWVNKHVQCIAVDADNAGAPYPHVLYWGSWGDGVYTFDGTTWEKLPNYPATAPAQFVRKIMLKSNGAAARPDVYAATNGYGLMKGTWTGATWAWTQSFTQDLFITALCNDGLGQLFAGTKTLGIYMSYDNGLTWGAMNSNPVITAPVSAIINTPIGHFAGTMGQGVYRFDNEKNTWFRIDTVNCPGWGVSVDPYINDLAFSTGTNTLFAGAGQQVLGATGNVYRITFANPTVGAIALQTLQVGTPYTYTLPISAAAPCSPKNWQYQVLSGALPPGLSFTLSNTPTPPTLTISGIPTEDCSYTVTVRVWDSLYNYVDVTVNFTVQLMSPSIFVVTTPTPLGSVMAFSTDSPATLGDPNGNLIYNWNFGDGALFPAVDSNLPAPTHIYTAPGNYIVTLWISDPDCAGVPPGPGPPNDCTLITAPDACNQFPVDVYAPLTVDPNATIVGSGSQFQFHPYASGGMPICATAINSGICPPPLASSNPGYIADGYTYEWYFYLGQAPIPPSPPSSTPPPGWIAQSCDRDPIETFTSTGNFWAWLRATDCNGHEAYGYCVVNYNGPMSATFASNTNPAPTGYPVFFYGTAAGCGLGPLYTFFLDFGDGSPAIGPLPPTSPPPAPMQFTAPYAYATAGTYDVTFTAKDAPTPGCNHTTVVKYKQVIYDAFTAVVVNQTTGNCVAGYPIGPVPKNMCFDVSPTGGLPPYMISVDWGDGSTSMVTGITSFPYNMCHTYSTAGVYAPVFYMTDSGHVAVTNSTTAPAFTLGNPLSANVTPACQSVLDAAAASWTITNTTVLSTGFAANNYSYRFIWNDGYGSETGWVPFAGASAVVNHTYPNYGSGVQTYAPTWYIRNDLNCEAIGPFGGLTVNVYYSLAPITAPSWTQDCGSRTVHFTASVPTTGVPPYTYKWDMGDGSLPYTTLGPTTTYTYATNGNFNAQLTVNDSATTLCGVIANQTRNVIYLVQVVEPISGTISGPSGDQGCAPFTGWYYSAMAGGAVVPPTPPFQPNPALNYTWSVSPSGGVTIASPNSWATNITFANPGYYSISLSVQSIAVPGYVCSATNTIDVVVYAGIAGGSLTFTQTETSGYLPLNDTFTTMWGMGGGSPAAPVTLTYNWGDGTPDTVINNATSPDVTQHTYTRRSPSTIGWKVTVTITDTCGNMDDEWRYIVILPPPELGATTTAIPQVGVAPLSVNFAVNPTGGVPAYAFFWDFGDGNTSSAQNPSHIYATPGIYYPTVQVGDQWPCDDPGITPACGTYFSGHWTDPVSVGAITVYGQLSVQAAVNPALGMVGTTNFSFTSTVAGGDGNYTYLWNFGDGQTSTSANPFHFYNNPGTYSAVLTVNDGAGHVGTSNAVLTTVYPNLNVTGSVNPTTVYPLPGSVTVTANALGGDGNYSYYYQWESFEGFEGPFTGPTANSRNHQYTTPGTHYIQVQVIDGLSNVAYLASALAVTSYDLLTININGTPVGSGDYVPKMYNFTSSVAGGSGGNVISWNFGDGSTGAGSAPSHTYTVPGTYSVTATVTDSVSHVAVSNTFNLTVYGPLTVAASATPQKLFINQPFTFDAAAQGGDGVYSYSWSFTGGGTASGATVNQAFATSGSKTATVTVNDGAGHSASASVTVTVWDPLVVTASATPVTGIKPLNVSFSSSATGGAGGYSYAWDFGDGGTSTAANTSHTYANPGTYFARVTVIDSANNSKTSSSIEISVYAAVTVSVSATPQAAFVNQPFTFNAVAQGGDGNYSYSWTFTGGGTGSGATANATFATSGTKTATVTVTDGVGGTGHTATASVNVTVWDPLTVTASATPTSGNKPLAVNFTASAAGGAGSYEYTWDFGDGGTGTGASPSHSYAADGIYYAKVTVKDAANNTKTSASVQITVYAPMTVSLSATPTSGILPLPVTFTAVAAGGDGNYTYSYTYGDGATGASPNHTYTAAGTYTAKVTVTDTASHSVTSSNVTITVWAPMTVSIASTATKGVTPFAPGFTATVAGGDGHYSYLWTFGDGTTSTSATPSKTYTTAGNFSAMLTVTDTSSHSATSNTIDITAWAPVTMSASATPALLIGPGPISFNAIVDGGDGNYTIAWTFGDGGTGTGATINHTYAVGAKPNFTYTVTVTVTDGVGGTGHTASKTLTVTVKPVPPTILQAIKLVPPQVPSWRLKLLGTNFQAGCVATINGTAVVTTFKNGGEIILKDCKALCPKDVPVTIVVTNPDGGISANFIYTRTHTP